MVGTRRNVGVHLDAHYSRAGYLQYAVLRLLTTSFF